MPIENPPTLFQGAPHGYARNDILANGPWVRNAIARQTNLLLGRCGQLLPGKSVQLASGQVRNSAADARLWVTRYRASANGTTLAVRVRLLPTDTTAGSPRWYLKVDGVAQASQAHDVRCAAGLGFDLGGVFTMGQEIAVTPGVKHTIELWTDDNCRVLGWSLHEKVRETLTMGVDAVADYSYALPLTPIRADTVSSIRAALDVAWQKHRGAAMSFCVNDAAAPIAVSSSAAANIFTSANLMPVVPTQYRNSYANEQLLGGVATKSIPTVCWAFMERTAGTGNVVARFIGGNHPAGVDVVCAGALGMYESVAFTLLPAAAGDTIRLQKLVSASGTTGNIVAAGCFPLVGT